MKTVWKIVLCALAAVLLIGLLVWMLVFDFQLPVLHFGSLFDNGSYTIMDASGEVTLPDDIHALNISWSSGSVQISTYDGSEIVLRETAQAKDSDRLRYQVENGTLRIRERNGSFLNVGSKSLEVLLPAKAAKDLSSLEIDAASATTTLEDLVVGKLEIDTASGDVTATDCVFDNVDYDGASSVCRMENCTINDFDMDTASGDAILVGEVSKISFDAASGNLTVVTVISPTKIEIDTASGDVDLTIPADSEFTLEYEKLSGNENISDFVGSFSDGKFVCGNGSAKFEIDTASGDLTLRAGK